MKLTYHRSGDYLLPNLAVPDAPISLGKYGRMHAAYLKEHKPILYNAPSHPAIPFPSADKRVPPL